MPTLTHRRDPDTSQDSWLVCYGDVRVGSIAMRAGVSIDKDQWGWSAGLLRPAAE